MFAGEIRSGQSFQIVEEGRQVDSCPFCCLIMQIESGSLFLHILYLQVRGLSAYNSFTAYINMDYFLLLRFGVVEATEGQEQQLDWLQAELLKQEDERYSNATKFHFTNLTFANNFREAITTLLRKIHEIQLSFTNIQLVSDQPELFTHILPQEFINRTLPMPHAFTNFLDWRALCRQKYGCLARSLQDTAKFLNLMEQQDPTVMLKMLLKRLREEKVIEDTDAKFYRQHRSAEEGEFAYFRCLGLPFQISKHEFVQRVIEPQRFGIKSYGFSLIFQHGKFSGKAVVKVPAEWAEMVQRKDRMYIGRRYVQINSISQEEFEGYKLQEERQRQDRKGQQRRRSQSSGSSRSRSRDKLEIHSLLSEAAVKVRGLPYSLNSWDIEQIFKRFNFVRGSVKLGFMGERKSGQAVILFPNREEAERALCLQGFVVQGRYLELRVVNKELYDRFK